MGGHGWAWHGLVSSLKVLLRCGTHVAIVERYGFKGRGAPTSNAGANRGRYPMNQQRIEPAPQLDTCPKHTGLRAWLLREARRRQGSGQALTEFAMVVPLLLVIIYAMIIFALAIHTQIDFGNAISSGIRTATVLGDGSGLPNGQSAPGC